MYLIFFMVYACLFSFFLLKRWAMFVWFTNISSLPRRLAWPTLHKLDECMKCLRRNLIAHSTERGILTDKFTLL